MAKYKAAIVGCGNRGGQHAQSYAHMKRAELVACCDPVEGNRERLAGEYNCRAYEDAREMIEKEKPDLVHLVTWPNTRVELMTLVAECNLPACTVEKPIAIAVNDWKGLCELEAGSRTKFAVSHQCRWQVNFAKCLQAVRGGSMGKVLFLDLSAGMNISGQGTHILNYGMALNNDVPVRTVFGASAGSGKLDDGHPAPDMTSAYLIFENGVRASWNNGPVAPRCGDPEVEWKHVRVAAYAQTGRVSWEEFAGWEIVSPDGCDQGDFGGMEVWDKNNIISQAAFHEAVIDWLEDDAKATGTNLKQSLHEWKTVLALYASSLWRRPVTIADFDPPEDLFSQLADALKGGVR